MGGGGGRNETQANCFMTPTHRPPVGCSLFGSNSITYLKGIIDPRERERERERKKNNSRKGNFILR